MNSARFEPAITARERPWNHALHREASEITTPYEKHYMKDINTFSADMELSNLNAGGSTQQPVCLTVSAVWGCTASTVVVHPGTSSHSHE